MSIKGCQIKWDNGHILHSNTIIYIDIFVIKNLYIQFAWIDILNCTCWIIWSILNKQKSIQVNPFQNRGNWHTGATIKVYVVTSFNFLLAVSKNPLLLLLYLLKYDNPDKYWYWHSVTEKELKSLSLANVYPQFPPLPWVEQH